MTVPYTRHPVYLITAHMQGRHQIAPDADCPSCPCPYGATDGDECDTIRERSVAGISNDIPDCPLHGPHKDTLSHPSTILPRSFKIVCWDGHDLDSAPGTSNAVRVATMPEAEAYGRDLYRRWMGLRRWEVQSSDEPVSCVWNVDTSHLDWIEGAR
jgi:hypothetical protein